MKYRGYLIRVGGTHPDGVVQIWQGEVIISRTTSIDEAKAEIDHWVDGSSR